MTTLPTPQRSKGEATRALIVSAALSLAESGGLDSLTIGHVAERVGMSKSGVFAHFGSREDLQLAVLELATNNFSTLVMRPAIKLKRGITRLRAMFENMLEFQASAAHGCVILSASHEFDDKPGAVRDAVLTYMQQLRREIVRATHYAIEVGELDANADAEQLAFEFFGIYLVAHHDIQTMRDPRAAERARRAIDRLIVSGSQP